MNNIEASFNPLSSLRKSFKRELPVPIPKNSNNTNNTTTTTTTTTNNINKESSWATPGSSPVHLTPQRSASVKRLPFSIIKSNTPTDAVEAELPPSPKLLDDNSFLYAAKTNQHRNPNSSAFVRSSHKTSSFHTYSRRTFRWIDLLLVEVCLWGRDYKNIDIERLLSLSSSLELYKYKILNLNKKFLKFFENIILLCLNFFFKERG